MKLAVVGGGSTYTPELVDGFARLRDTLPVERARAGRPGGRPAGAGRRPGPADLRQAGPPRPDRRPPPTSTPGVDGADAVLLQLRVGGQAARNQDETWPLECGCVGQETTGAGGLAKALRTVPVVLDIAERVRARRTRTPGSSTSPTRSASSPAPCSRPGTRPSACATWRSASSASSPRCSDVAPERGPPRPRRASTTSPGSGRAPGRPGRRGRAARAARRARRRDRRRPAPAAALLDRARRRALVLPALLLRARRGRPGAAAPSRRAPPRSPRWRRELLEMYGDPALDEKPALLAKRGGAFYSEAAVRPGRLAAGRRGGPAGRRRWSTLRNNGTLPFLPDDAVIEVPARSDGTGAQRRCRSPPLDPLYAGLIAHVTAYEDLALDAALHGGRDRVFKALLAHPLVGQFELRRGAHRPAARAQPGAPGVGRDRRRRVLAIDAGNSKTDVAWSPPTARVLGSGPRRRLPARRRRASDRGRRRARPRWPSRAALGRRPADGPASTMSSACLANADLPVEERDAEAGDRAAAAGRRRTRSQRHLRAAARRRSTTPRGVAVVCGAGHQLRRACCRTGAPPASPRSAGISGDWGGGRRPGRGGAVVRRPGRGRPRRADRAGAARCPRTSGWPRCTR